MVTQLLLHALSTHCGESGSSYFVVVGWRRRPPWVGGQVSLQFMIDMKAEDDHAVATRTRVFDLSIGRGPEPKAGEGTGGEEAPRDSQKMEEARAGD
eukprot:3314088-Pyramimonas_sp.AAC.1